MKQPIYKAMAVAITLAASAVVPVSAQTGEEADVPLVNETVVVVGRRPAETKLYVEEVLAPPIGAEQVARWDDRICVGVSGASPAHSQFLIDRIASTALEIGLRAGKPGCSPDISIVVTSDPDRVVQALEVEHGDLFAIRNEPRAGSLGRDAFQQFKTESRPVRWWHVSETRGADGMRLSGEARQGITDGVTGAPTVRSEGSRLRASTREDLSHAIIIVDAGQIQDVSLESLSDFISFVALAQVDPNGNTSSVDTVLNLFRSDFGEKRPTQLTTWDRDFLRALYSMPRNTVSLVQAQSFLATRLEKSAPKQRAD